MPVSHSLFRLYESIHNVPHLITPTAFNVILDYLESRNDNGIDLAVSSLKDRITPDVPPEDDYPSDSDDDGSNASIAILSIDGSLTYKPVMTMCGEVGTSYMSLVDQVQDMADSGVKTIIMEVTSGGGEASHVFQAAEEVRSICDDNGIQLIGYADTIAASAAYAWICICDEVVANPSASLGSIGCVVALMDTSKAMEQAGLKRIFITSGENKVPFAADGSFKQEFLDDIQTQVNLLNDEFAAFVSKYTGLDVDTVKGFQAKVFNASDAVTNGLANQVMTNSDFAQYVANLHKGAVGA